MKSQRKRIRVSSRALYAMIGWICGMTLGVLLYFVWKPHEFLLVFFSLAGMVMALWYGEATNRIPTFDEINRPITLFPKDYADKRE